MVKNSSTNFSIKKIILSRSRSDSIITHKFLNDAVLLVPESEKMDYVEVIGDSCKIRTIPDSYKGLSAVRNWCLDNFKEDCLIMFDDDIKGLFCICREAGFWVHGSNDIDQVLENAAFCAKGAKCGVFGFNQAWDVRKYQENQPFKLVGWVGGVIGVIGRKNRFDEHNKLRVDIDFCLTNLLKNRIIWIDNRFSFVQKRFSNKGGNSVYRTMDSDKRELDYLKTKWGSYLKFPKSKTQQLVRVNIKRTQK